MNYLRQQQIRITLKTNIDYILTNISKKNQHTYIHSTHFTLVSPKKKITKKKT